ncbi:hypothetical protein HGM15179_017291 [Zosterops borbonicus]|uniref:Immunoglobulin C1-set domain-containing protein n=1 Tax=Zosterops borbonicus TaxID=364589 RepID=A0A8K1G1C5_9PASS|nr:hypothetical protein HGM15179_017291 [Zosterops borbonicus]
MDFYPAHIQLRWFEGQQELSGQVVATDVIPNGDWTHQLLVLLERPPRRGLSYTCQVEHVSLEQPLRRHCGSPRKIWRPDLQGNLCLNAFCVTKTFKKGKRLDVNPIVEHEDWDAADPVVIENKAAKWKPFDWKVLRKAKETVKTYGLRSEAAQNIIHYIYTVDLLCPADCTSIASLLLTPLQLLIFGRQWQCLAAEEASRHRQPMSRVMRRTDAFAALIRKGRDRIVEIDRKEPADISIPTRDEDRIDAIMSSV